MTERATLDTPMGAATFVSTIEFEPTPVGTIVHFRFAPPKTAKERAIMREIASMFDTMFEEHGAQLASRLHAELMVGQAGGDEPTLPAPRPDGVLASAL